MNTENDLSVCHVVEHDLKLLSSSENSVQGSIFLKPDFPGFQGHFPNQPIVPGIAFIVIAQSLIEAGTGKKYLLRSVKRTKFYQPVSPDTELFLSAELQFVTSGIQADVLFHTTECPRIALVRFTLDEVNG